MWPRHEIGLDGTYYAYFPFSPMIERSQMTPYHDKLICCQSGAVVALT